MLKEKKRTPYQITSKIELNPNAINPLSTFSPSSAASRRGGESPGRLSSVNRIGWAALRGAPAAR